MKLTPQTFSSLTQNDVLDVLEEKDQLFHRSVRPSDVEMPFLVPAHDCDRVELCFLGHPQRLGRINAGCRQPDYFLMSHAKVRKQKPVAAIAGQNAG